jgi:hypothetical protein
MTAVTRHARRVSTPGGGVQGVLTLIGDGKMLSSCPLPYDQDVPRAAESSSAERHLSNNRKPLPPLDRPKKKGRSATRYQRFA